MDEAGRLVTFKNVHLQPYGSVRRVMFCGVHVFDPIVFDFLPASGYCCVNETAYPAMLHQGLRVYGFEYRGPWLELGTPADYLRANLDLLSGRVKLSVVRPAQLDRLRSGVLSGEDVLVEPGAQIGPEVVLGSGCHVLSSAQIAHSVIWPGCRLQGKIEGAVVAGDDLKLVV